MNFEAQFVVEKICCSGNEGGITCGSTICWDNSSIDGDDRSAERSEMIGLDGMTGGETRVEDTIIGPEFVRLLRFMTGQV